MRLTLEIVKQVFRNSKNYFLFAKFCKDENGEIKISSFYTKWKSIDYLIESVGDSDYNEMVKIYKWMNCVDEEVAKDAIWYRKIKENPIKQKNQKTR